MLQRVERQILQKDLPRRSPWSSKITLSAPAFFWPEVNVHYTCGKALIAMIFVSLQWKDICGTIQSNLDPTNADKMAYEATQNEDQIESQEVSYIFLWLCFSSNSLIIILACSIELTARPLFSLYSWLWPLYGRKARRPHVFAI